MSTNKIDLVRAEIERLLNKEWSLSDSTEAKYRREAYKELLDFIDSLPEEQVSEQLEEEYRNYLKQARMEHKISHSETVAAIYFASYEKNKFINEACEWLKSYRQETSDETGYIAGIVNDKTIEEFRKAMED